MFPKTSNPSGALIVQQIPLAIMTNDDAIVPSKAHSVGFNCMWEADQNCWLDDVKSGSFDLMIVD